MFTPEDAADDGTVIRVTGSNQVLDLKSSQNDRTIEAPGGTTIRFGFSDLTVISADLYNPDGLKRDFEEIHDTHVVSLKLRQGLPQGRIPIEVDLVYRDEKRLVDDTMRMSVLVIPMESDNG